MASPLIDVTELAEKDPYRQVDELYVGNQEPEFYYCWLRNKPQDIAKNRAIGQYEICNEKTTKATPLCPPDSNGEYRMGDLVLARMPRQRWEQLEKRRIRQVKEEMTTANTQWIEAVAKAGLKVDDTTKTEPFERTVRGAKEDGDN